MTEALARTHLFEARPFKDADAPLAASWMSFSPMELFMLSSALSFPVTAEALLARIRKADPKEHKFYSVFLNKDGRHVGYFEIKNINERHLLGTGSHVILSPEWRGKGMGKDFIDLISKTAFSTLGLYRISLTVCMENPAAIAAYKKAGYSQEGVLRELLAFEGKRYSFYQMSLLRPEWEKMRNGP